ncbi:TPA: hypothetical protein L4847_005604 [Pseudomonas aeruginosa]|uniref:hypothetical protein n=1 Tax=Pseudomonas aeruginosa TaxID=287 RepID=UPI000ACE8076|nr:hypothetical protein [Pseudomonas aeruginosa]KAA5621959.1 hypothetical protein F3H11_31930 [Pseudomonas aeruginosa]KAA5636939.1 hypothetical protein F3G63_32930 [Pseudomonas aeruginosa]MCG0171118.1 hypothetical protein [Pseudomonas aeruginosa]MCG0187984.1 hypothetical protein [Pseudomonas aeruginosa]MCG0210614.1 hypothetical protein [Pseudomonas aeruginosa]
MKQSNWHVLKTKNRNLPTVHGFLDDDGNLIIQNEGDGLAIFTNEKVGIADFVRGAHLLHVSGPGEYAGSWRYSGTDKTRGDAHTPYPLIFTKVSS